jgi:type II secretory pathway component PulJ
MTDRRMGFTLIEVVGAFFMMVVILVLITGIFVENGRQRTAATELMRERLSATGALDLMANDLEGAIFVARAEDGTGDPESHPWRVLAESGGDYGAIAIRFVTQNAPSSNTAEHVSNWVEVAYFLEDDDEGEQVLWRWRSARPPNEAPNGFPDSSEFGSMRVAVGVSEFGVRFLDFEGNWLDEWDSTFQPSNQALPEAAEISLALFRAARRGESLEGETQVPGLLHVRRVSMVMRPIDVAALIQLEEDGDEEAGCFTISQCLDEGDNDWHATELEDDCGGDDELCELLANPGESCWSAIESGYPEVAARAAESCGS